jgi:hypothetical protein
VLGRLSAVKATTRTRQPSPRSRQRPQCYLRPLSLPPGIGQNVDRSARLALGDKISPIAEDQEFSRSIVPARENIEVPDQGYIRRQQARGDRPLFARVKHADWLRGVCLTSVRVIFDKILLLNAHATPVASPGVDLRSAYESLAAKPLARVRLDLKLRRFP